MTGSHQLDYDRSGRFAIDDDGWQVVAIGRMLYPGGPHAMRVVSPDYPPFHAGWRFASHTRSAEAKRIVISHIGTKLGGSSLPTQLFPSAILARIQERLRAYIMTYPDGLFGEEIAGVNFVDDDPMAEIF